MLVTSRTRLPPGLHHMRATRIQETQWWALEQRRAGSSTSVNNGGSPAQCGHQSGTSGPSFASKTLNSGGALDAAVPASGQLQRRVMHTCGGTGGS
eukprot:362750-Chlamydomonas_euryale.AAC.2